MDFFHDFIIVLISAVFVLILISRFKIPSVIGFLLTGIIIGPAVLSLVKAGELDLMAEVGVMLLMFNIGLEFSLDKIKQMKHEVLVLGGLQIIFTIAVALFIMHFSGFSVQETILASFVISMSSTAIVMKILKDNSKLQTPSGKMMVGILLFQDICVVPLIILTPILGSLEQAQVFPILFELAKSFALIVAIFVLAKYLLPKAFDYVIGMRVQELFMILVLGLCFGLALLTHSIGFSLALGSFIAGMILAESDFIYQIEADVKPLKNVFLSIFFISVGMLLNVDYIFENPGNVVLGVFSILLLKAIIVFGIVVLFKNPINLAIVVGLGVAQIGEFSFMLLNIAKPINIISNEFYDLFLSIIIISMLITPLLLFVSDKIGGISALKKNISGSDDRQNQHVIIAGYGINGLNLSKIFKALNIPYKIIEINPNTVKKYKKEGEDIVYGDITQPDNLEHIGVKTAALFVIAISDAEATLRAVELSRKMNRDLYIIVRSEFITQIETLYKKGADIVISQDFEASLEISSYVLKYFGISDSITRLKADQLRKRHYNFFSEDLDGENSLKIADLAAIENFNETYFVLGNSELVGKTVGTVNDMLFSDFENGVRIIAIIREEKVVTDLLESLVIEKMDTIILFGQQQSLDNAVELLNNFK